MNTGHVEIPHASVESLPFPNDMLDTVTLNTRASIANIYNYFTATPGSRDIYGIARGGIFKGIGNGRYRGKNSLKENYRLKKGRQNECVTF